MSTSPSSLILALISGKGNGDDNEHGFLNGWRRRQRRRGQQWAQSIFPRGRMPNGVGLAAAVVVGSASAFLAAQEGQKSEERSQQQQQTDERTSGPPKSVPASGENESSDVTDAIAASFRVLLDQFNQAEPTTTTGEATSAVGCRTESNNLEVPSVRGFKTRDWAVQMNVIAAPHSASAAVQRSTPLWNPSWRPWTSSLSALPPPWSTAPETTRCFFGTAPTPRLQPTERTLRRNRTIAEQLDQAAETKETLEQKYRVNWRRPLGEGAFGAVYAATNKQTGQRVAVKKISKRFTSHVTFQNEMGALLHIRANGGHPNICGLQENFEEHQDDDPESGFFYLVLDLIAGGEMFDHLCNQGAYSEAEAARMIREVASAMNFIHGIGVVHGDMKPENLMLSTKEPASAVVKVVDFGCAQVAAPDSQSDDGTIRTGGTIKALQNSNQSGGTANTPAYSAPEVLKIKAQRRELGPNAPPQVMESVVIDPSFDMWAVGVILYIMLTGVHPFDLCGNAMDVDIENAIVSGKRPPLGDSKLTEHLSPDAISVIEQLLQWDPKRRLTAHQLLEHPWVRGETARTSKIAGSDKRLSAYRSFKTKLQAKAFAEMVSQSADAAYSSSPGEGNAVMQRTSLIELAFQKFERDSKGMIPAKELRKFVDGDSDDVSAVDDGLSLSGFSDILSDNMQNKYFSKGHVIYKEGEIGNYMYFLNSGSIEVFAKDGHRSVRNAGEFFGEGALLNPKKTRSASIRCLTPVHAIEISREYFEKYLASDEGLMYNLKEHDKARKRQRAKMLLQIQQNTTEATFKEGEYLFKQGETGNEVFVVSGGRVVLMTGDQEITTVEKGEMTGEHSTVFGKARNVNARCVSVGGCGALVLRSRDFARLLRQNPGFKDSVREICLRREFQKALCHKIRHPFPKDEKGLRKAFDLIDTSKSNSITLDEIRALLLDFDPTYKEQDVKDILNALRLDEDTAEKGVGWAEFQRIFGMDEKEKDASGGGKAAGLRRKKWKRGG